MQWLLKNSQNEKRVSNIVYQQMFPDGCLSKLTKNKKSRRFSMLFQFQNATKIKGLTLNTRTQGPTNIFDKTCPWASGRQKALARQDDLVVQYIA